MLHPVKMSDCKEKKSEATFGEVEEIKSKKHLSFSESVVGAKDSTTKTSMKEPTKKVSWLHRLFGQPLSKYKSQPTADKEHCIQPQRGAPSDGPSTTTVPQPEEDKQRTKKKKGLCRLFNYFRKRNKVVPSCEEEAQQEIPQEQHKKSIATLFQVDINPKKDVQKQEFDKRENTVKLQEVDDPKNGVKPQEADNLKNVVKQLGFDNTNMNARQQETGNPKNVVKQQVVDNTGKNAREQETGNLKNVVKQQVVDNPKKTVEPEKTKQQKDVKPHNVRDQQICWFGFPNSMLLSICYMNSSLQSLLTLTEFVRDVSNQEEVYSLIPDQQLILSQFMNIVRCHSSRDVGQKLKALLSFKKALSLHAPEFQDFGVKDAHEFLTMLFYQIRNLTPSLQQVAALLGKSYICPVEGNMMFKMQNTRTCRSCGHQSIRQEEFNNLSLDLIPGGSVQEMLLDYQKETELDYKCDCGCTKSSQRLTFLTMPRVLILHLKRFSFNEYLQMVKLCQPVVLLRELMVSSSQQEASYNLVSIISHEGQSTNTGHYVSSGLHVHEELDSRGDRWLWTAQESYILFYHRQD